MKLQYIQVTLKIPVTVEDDTLDAEEAFKNADFESAMLELRFGTREERDSICIDDGTEIVSVENVS